MTELSPELKGRLIEALDNGSEEPRFTIDEILALYDYCQTDAEKQLLALLFIGTNLEQHHADLIESVLDGSLGVTAEEALGAMIQGFQYRWGLTK